MRFRTNHAPARALVLVLLLVSGHLAVCPGAHAGPQDDGVNPEAVNKAIDRGVQRLRETQSLEGRWTWKLTGRSTRSGATALAVYALLKSGVSETDPAVRRGLAALEQMPTTTTYDAASVILLLLAHAKKAHAPRIESLVAQLVREQSAGVWGYPGGADLSNTQYAAIALWSARNSGFDVPDKVWVQLAQALPRYTKSKGGFTYRDDHKAKATPSMTAAGLTCISICRGFLGADLEGVKRAKQLRKDFEAFDTKGTKWLGTRYLRSRFKTMTTNGLGYFFYGVERLGALTGDSQLGKKDWYDEGAQFLLDEQQEDGGWGQLYAGSLGTSFTLLFLNRATAKMAISGPGSSKVGAARKTPEPTADAMREADWLVSLARDYTSNLFPRTPVGIVASTSAKGHGIGSLTDGARMTYWASKKGDEAPTLTLTFPLPVDADTIVLGHPVSRDEVLDLTGVAPVDSSGKKRKKVKALPARAAEVVVTINGAVTKQSAMPAHSLDRLRVELGATVRIETIEITLMRRDRSGKDPLGLSEVELHKWRQ